MVSYPDDPSHPPPRALNLRPVRAPSSIASSVSTSARRHHHRHASGRSHSGGGGGGGGASTAVTTATARLANEFPCFHLTGDVEVVVSSGRKEMRYVLHRLILAQCSGFFEAGMSEEWSRVREGGSGSGAEARRWRYELDWGNGDEDVPMLVQKPSPSIFGAAEPTTRPPPLRPKPPPPSSSGGFFRNMANITSLNLGNREPEEQDDPADDVLRTYDNLFRVFYNYPPNLSTANIADAYVECKSLLHAADMYDALSVIGPRVDHHLLRFQSRLWKQIAKYPPSYLKLAYLARSRAIFSEALIHVVGQWPAALPQLRNQVPQRVLDLIEDKVFELDDTKARVEAKLWRITLTTSRGERVSPANAWLDWLMISLWRQWFAENTTPPPVGILKSPNAGGVNSRNSSHSRTRSGSSGRSAGAPTANNELVPANSGRAPAPGVLNTGLVFRKIGVGGPAYLNHDAVKRFLKLTPEAYSRDNLRRAERRLEEIKNMARDAVQPLMRNFLELEIRGAVEQGGGLGYLTCTRVEEGDWPWEE